jgi:hypothetical protein
VSHARIGTPLQLFVAHFSFLFGFQPKDKHYDVVSSILKVYMATKPLSTYYPVSALIETREVLADHKKDAAERLNAITLIKANATSSGLLEVGLFSDDLIL